MSAWLWGLRHQVRFRSLLVDYAGDSPIVEIVAGDFAINTNVLPLAESYSEGDPRQRLTWFPRHGDLFAVDAPNYQLISDNYYYSSGPVMRMVMSLNNGVTEGRNILPGGQSGRMESEHFADQCSLWLGNDTVPMRLDVAQVVEGATGREFYTGQ
jgi:acyl-homoserine lactone acylase PvdQ